MVQFNMYILELKFRLLYIPEIDAYFMEILVRNGKCFSAFRLS